MYFRIVYVRSYGGYRVDIRSRPAGRLVAWAGWWGAHELESARRWARAAMADYDRPKAA